MSSPLRSILSALAALLALASFASPAVWAEQTLRIGTGDWAPYVDQQRDDAGALGRLVTAVFAEAGYRVRFVFMPWKRNLLMLQQGELDAVMPYSCTRARQAYSRCSAPLAVGEMVLFRRRDLQFQWQRVEDLAPYRIGTNLGYAYGAPFDAAQQAGLLRIEQNAKAETAFRLLLLGRIDLHPQYRAVGYTLLRRHFSAAERAQIDHHPRSLSQESLHLLFRQDGAQAAELLQLFNRGLLAFAERGELQRLQAALYSGTADSWVPGEEP